MRKKLIYLTEFLFLIYIIMFNNFIVDYFLKYLDLINVIFFGILSLVMYFLVGFPRSKKIINYSAMQTMIIGFIIYYTFTYILGLFFGFSANVYSLKFINIVKNIVFAIGYYSFREMYRYMIIRQTNDRKNISYILITILFILLDIIMEVNGYDLTTGVGIFKFICSSVIPSVAINMLVSYLLHRYNFKCSILFILILKLPNYFMPIFPNIGYYLSSVLLIILIFYLYYQFSLILEKYDRKINVKKQKKMNVSLFVMLVLIILLVGVVSGVFKYHMFAIVSNSMVPVFSRGDAVLVEKLRDDELEKLKIDDIIAFYSIDGRMIVHRIVSINKDGDNYFIKTKGDNNEIIDSWTVKNEDVYGKVITQIKYIGIPSVELSELISK